MLALIWAYSGAVIGVMYTKADDQSSTALLEDTEDSPVDSHEKDADPLENQKA
jgi:hypothetical protein